MDAKGSRKPIENERELEFAVFCIENVAARLGKPSDEVYRALTGKGDILNQYIVPCYEPLHTQGRDYIVNCPLDEALKRFYLSMTYRLMRDGVSDMHCMSVRYLVEEIVSEGPRCSEEC